MFYDNILLFIQTYIIPSGIEFWIIPDVSIFLAAFVSCAFMIYCIVRPFYLLIKYAFSSNSSLRKRFRQNDDI